MTITVVDLIDEAVEASVERCFFFLALGLYQFTLARKLCLLQRLQFLHEESLLTINLPQVLCGSVKLIRNVDLVTVT